MTWGVLLILVGLTLLVAELFLPSGGVLFFLAITAIVVGVVWIFTAPESEGGGVTAGLITVVALSILLPTAIALGVYWYPHTALGRRVMLAKPDSGKSLAEALELDKYRGSYGKTLTPHQPSGVTLIDGRRIDSISEGMYLDAGQVVKVVGVQGVQLVVRPLQGLERNEVPESLRDLPSDLLG